MVIYNSNLYDYFFIYNGEKKKLVRSGINSLDVLVLLLFVYVFVFGLLSIKVYECCEWLFEYCERDLKDGVV